MKNAILSFLRAHGWAIVRFIAVALAALHLFGPWLSAAVEGYVVIWVCQRLIDSPAMLVRDVVGFFATATKWMADVGAPAIKNLNTWAKGLGKRQAKPAPAAQVSSLTIEGDPTGQQAAFAMAGLGGPAESATTEAEPKSRVDWGRFWKTVLNPRFWAVVLVLLAIVFVARCTSDVTDFFTPSGREVAAEARAENAEVNQGVAEHERDVAIFGADRQQQANAAAERAQRAAREAQEDIADAIANLPPAPDAAFFAELNRRYRDGYERVWDNRPFREGEPDRDPTGTEGLLPA